VSNQGQRPETIGSFQEVAMKYFLCRLLPPRPTFAQDMTETEAKVMRAHVAYWTDLAERGTAIVFGPVADPKGVWGVGILEVGDEAQVQSLTANDPVMLEKIGTTYEILPMPRTVIGRKRQPL
jgi:uncharacterized protein